MVVAAVFALGYVAVSLQGQISTLTMHLEAGKKLLKRLFGVQFNFRTIHTFHFAFQFIESEV